jgi:endonuclease/exonuclease/phosphatase family metal-dependent hydrolase
MKKVFSLVFILFVLFSKGQNLEIPAFGSDSTFEVITWTIEWFPKNGETTVQYVKEIIEDLDVDLVAMQELDDIAMFDQMMLEMADYEGYYESSYFAGLAYIYNINSIQIDTIYEILTTQPYWRPFPRSPMVMELTFKNDEYVVINNHFKCCGDGNLDLSDPWDEETRRYDASNLLEQYISNNFQDRRVILTGDFNDDIAENFVNNVFGAFLDKPDGYLFTDMEIAEGSSSNWSYPSWPSHLDHILITEPVFADMLNSGSVTEALKIDQYFNSWNEYDANVTDHRPVGIRVNGDYSVSWEENNEPLVQMVVYPNPTSNSVKIKLNSLKAKQGSIDIYSLSGAKLKSFNISDIDGIVTWEPENDKKGIYLIKYIIPDEVVSIQKVIVK